MEEASVKEKCQGLLGNYLKMKRRERDLTQEEVGINVGYSPHTAKQAISQIERGITWVPDKKLNEFVEFLVLDASFFSLLSHYYSIRKYEEVYKMLRNLMDHEVRSMSESMRIKIAPAEMQTPAEPVQSIESKLEKLRELHEKGLIDDEDYKEAKREALKKFMD